MSHAARLALLCAPAILLTLVPAEAAPRRARLTVEVKVEGTEKVIGSGSEQTSSKFREGYTIVTYLNAEGDLEQFNTKDPAYGQKMMGMAAGVNAKVAQAQGRAPAKKMSQAEMQAYLQKKQAACGTDTNCLMKLGQEANDLMLANMNPGQGSATAYTGDEPPRYLTYLGFDNCGARVHTYVDRTISGTFDDVQGAVPYTIKETVDYDNNADELRLICNFHQAVLDTQDGSIWTDGAIAPHYKGTTTTTMRGKTTTATATEFGHGETLTWISEQLRHAPRAGHKTITLKLTQNQGGALHTGRYSGEAVVDLSWRFEDVK
jgi:hypothetical protein